MAALPVKNEDLSMRMSDQFMLRQVADETLVIPVGEAALRLKGLIGLSESGGMLCRLLQSERTEAELAQALAGEYGIEHETALADTRAFLDQMRALGILIEE